MVTTEMIKISTLGKVQGNSDLGACFKEQNINFYVYQSYNE